MSLFCAFSNSFFFRRYGVIPSFVCNCSQASKLFGDCVVYYKRKFQEKVLNRLIEEKFRLLNHLRSRREAAVRAVRTKMLVSDAEWSCGHSCALAEFECNTQSQKLRRKLDALLGEEKKFRESLDGTG